MLAELQDTIYQGLVFSEKVMHGAVETFHFVIDGKINHAVKTLSYADSGNVESLYTGPLSNSGTKDWKYKDYFAEGDNPYRNSKWLEMIESRLLVTRELLNSANAIVQVTIDDREYLPRWAIHVQTVVEFVRKRGNTDQLKAGLIFWNDAPTRQLQKFNFEESNYYLTEQ